MLNTRQLSQGAWRMTTRLAFAPRSYATQAPPHKKWTASHWMMIGTIIPVGAVIYTTISRDKRPIHTTHTVRHHVKHEPKTAQDHQRELRPISKAETEAAEPGAENSGEVAVPLSESQAEARRLLEPIRSKYVIVGAGTAAFAAAQTILKKEPNAQILMIGEESYLPYMRPPLSKELWFSKEADVAETLNYTNWQGEQQNLFYANADTFEVIDQSKPFPASSQDGPSKIKLLTRVRAISLNVPRKQLKLSTGQYVHFDKILIATGGSPKLLPCFEAIKDSPHVTTYRNLDDFKKLTETVKNGGRVAIIGGGFMGSELSVALAHQAKTNEKLQVTQVFPEEGNMGAVFPRYLSEWTTKKVQQLGINVVNRSTVTAATVEDGKVVLTVDVAGSPQSMTFDHVVVAVGISPNVDLARVSGLEIDETRGGIIANAELEARSDVYVAGDASSFYDIALGRRRVEHYDHAVITGRIAGLNMTGHRQPYKHQSMFWSDLGPEIGYEAVGILDSKLKTVGIWGKASAPAPPATDGASTTPEATPELSTPVVASPPTGDEYNKGVVFYMRDKKVVGVLLWNVYERVPTARKIIRDGKEYEDLSELGRMFKFD